MKLNYFGFLVLVSVLAAQANAQSSYSSRRDRDQGVCGNHSRDWNTGNCITTGAAAAGATAGGVYAAKKYGDANSIEKQFEKRLLTSPEGASQNSNDVGRVFDVVTEGDRVKMSYQLNEKENREYHIRLMDSSASSAESSAKSNEMTAMTAMKANYEMVNGKMEYRGMEPDYVARSIATSQAISDHARAAEYREKAAAARAGGPVPTYTLDKSVEGDTGTRVLARDFATKSVEKGGRILTVDRLPAEHFKAFKAARGVGTGVAVGAGLAAAFAAEEAFAGMAGDALNKTGYVPAFKGFGAEGAE